MKRIQEQPEMTESDICIVLGAISEQTDPREGWLSWRFLRVPLKLKQTNGSKATDKIGNKDMSHWFRR